MNTRGWSEEQLRGLRDAKKSLRYGLGWLAAEGVLIIGDATDKIPVPWPAHAMGIIGGVCLTGSNLLYLHDLRTNPPEPLGKSEQI